MGERWILAVDLGNGGPKVAVVSLEGEVRRRAMRAVSVHIEKKAKRKHRSRRS